MIFVENLYLVKDLSKSKQIKLEGKKIVNPCFVKLVKTCHELDKKSWIIKFVRDKGFFNPPLYTCFNHCVDGVQLNMLLFLHREFGKQHGFPIFSFYQLLPTHPNPVSQRQNYYFWHSNSTAYRNYVEFVILKWVVWYEKLLLRYKNVHSYH